MILMDQPQIGEDQWYHQFVAINRGKTGVFDTSFLGFFSNTCDDGSAPFQIYLWWMNIRKYQLF